MSLVTCRTVKRYFANGKGYATKRMAYYQIARRQLLDEFLASLPEGERDWYRFDENTSAQISGPANDAFMNIYGESRHCRTCGGNGSHPYGGACGCDGTDGGPLRFNSDAWHADIRARALELMAKEEAPA